MPLPARSPATDRSLAAAALALGGLGTALYRLTPVFDPDAFWHLHTGRYVLATRSVPSVDAFSHTAAGRRWDFVDWLADVILYGAHRLGGLPGLVVLTALLGGLGVAITVHRMLRRAPPPVVLALTPLVMGVGVFRVTPRPQTFTFALFSATLLLLDRPDGAWLVPPLLVLWQNLHSSAPLGLLALVAHAVGRALAARRDATPLDLRNTLGPVLLGALALLVAVHPIDRLRAGFGHMVDPALMALITEWQPMYRMPLATPVNVALEALVALALVAVAHAPTRRRLDPTAALVALGTTVLAVRAMRFVPLAAIALAPVAALGLAALAGWRPRARVAALALAAALGAVTVAAQRKPFGFGLLAGMFPEGAARWVDARQPRGRLLNDFNDGGYLMFTLGARHPVFSDGRSWALYDPAFLRDALQPDLSRLDRLVARYDLGLAVVYSDARIGWFQSRPGWSLAYFDDRAFVAIRDDVNPHLAGAAYRVLRPMTWSDDLPRWGADAALAARAWDESTRAVTEAPSASLPWVLRAAAAAATGRGAEADAAALRALALRPDGLPAHRAVLLRCAAHGDRDCACRHAAWVLARAPRNTFSLGLAQRFGCPR
jgi:hypothetical protein